MDVDARPARYQAILARDPHDPALAKLVAMYTRYRTLDALIAEYDAELDVANTKRDSYAGYEWRFVRR